MHYAIPPFPEVSGSPFVRADLIIVFARSLIVARTGEGRARAKAKGVHMERPPKLTPHQRQEALKRREAGETLTDIIRNPMRA
jgi:hypothetical protein